MKNKREEIDIYLIIWNILMYCKVYFVVSDFKGKLIVIYVYVLYLCLFWSFVGWDLMRV